MVAVEIRVVRLLRGIVTASIPTVDTPDHRVMDVLEKSTLPTVDCGHVPLQITYFNTVGGKRRRGPLSADD